MPSLKSYTPQLARLLETTPAALYERQRALVRANLLKQTEGWGPGSGVRVTVYSIAYLLIAETATSILAGSAERTHDIAITKPVGGICPVTRARSFHDAIAFVIASERLARRVKQVKVSHSSPYAEIWFHKSKSIFSSGAMRQPSLRIVAEIEGLVLQNIARDLASMLNVQDEAEQQS